MLVIHKDLFRGLRTKLKTTNSRFVMSSFSALCDVNVAAGLKQLFGCSRALFKPLFL